MKLIAIAALFLSFSAFADLNKDIARLAKIANVGSNGGEAFIAKYDVKKFKYDVIVKELLESIKGSDCAFTPFIGKTALLSNATSTVIFYNSKEADKILTRLNKKGEIKAATGYYWTDESGDSEYCSREDLNIYFTNGTVLYISHDSTT